MMTKALALTLLVTTLIVSSIANAEDAPPATKPSFVDTPEARNARIAWWREARFGMFIHWGIYSVPAGEYQGKPVSGIGEWIMNRAKIPVKEYEKFAAEFNPVKFDAEAWAQLAQDAGMKYMVITSKHHDGFAMFGSKVSPYNIVDATPFKRDPMKELSAACAKRGIKFCFYYSQSLDWHEPNGMGNQWDFGPDADKKFDEYLEKKSLPQVREILSNYGPLGLIWFDVPKSMTPERTIKFRNAVRELQPNCLISGRLGEGNNSDYASEGDNRVPAGVRPGDWETPATLNNTWGYKKDDDHWKTPEQLVFNLVDIVSKGGNYLLNVGPTSEGIIPQPSIDMLHVVGDWMKVNGESIHGCGATVFGAEFGDPKTAPKDDKGRVKASTRKEWRCTSKPGFLYIHFFVWPVGKFELPPIKGKVSKAYMLAARDVPVPFAQDGEKLSVELPHEPPGKIAFVLALELQK